MDNERDSASFASLPDIPAIGAGEPVQNFDVFLRDQFRSLVQFLRARTATEQDAEDAAQESMTKLLRYRDS